MRITPLIKKETKQLIRDKGFILTAILEPIIFILIFGYGYSGNIENISTLIINHDNSSYSEMVVDAINESVYLKINGINQFDKPQSLEKINQSEYRNLIVIPPDFGKNLDNGEKTEIYSYLDSSDYFIYTSSSFGLSEVMKNSLNNITEKIIEELEQEKTSKKEEFDELKQKVGNLGPEVDWVIVNFKNISSDLDKAITNLNRLNQQLQSGNLVLLDDSITEISQNIDSVKNNLLILSSTDPELASALNPYIESLALISNETLKLSQEVKNSGIEEIPSDITYLLDETRKQNIEMDKINENISSIHQLYKNISDQINSVSFDLQNLKKEFLSLPISLENEFIFGEISYFEYLVPGIISLVIFFITVVSAANNIIDEKDKKTYYRLEVTPLTKHELFIGKFLVFFTIGIIESVYVLLLVWFFGIAIWANFIEVFIILLFLIASSVSLGLFISSQIKTTRQGMMIIPLVIIPSVLLAGIFSPLDILPFIIKKIAQLIPVYYSTEALRIILVKNLPLRSVIKHLAALFIIFMTLVGLTLLSFKFKKNN